MAGAFGGSSNRYCAGDSSSCLPFSQPENGSQEGRAKDGYDVRRCGLNRSGIVTIDGAVVKRVFPWSGRLLKRGADTVAELIRKGMPNRATSSVAAATETKCNGRANCLRRPPRSRMPKLLRQVARMSSQCSPQNSLIHIRRQRQRQLLPTLPGSRSNVIRSSLATQDRRPPMSSPQAGTNRNGLTEPKVGPGHHMSDPSWLWSLKVFPSARTPLPSGSIARSNSPH